MLDVGAADISNTKKYIRKWADVCPITFYHNSVAFSFSYVEITYCHFHFANLHSLELQLLL